MGEPEAPGIRLKNLREGTAGFFHNWLPMQFDDYMLKVQFDEMFDGTRIVEESVKVYNIGIDKEPEQMGRPSSVVKYIPGTREMESAIVTLDHPSGRKVVIHSQPLRTVYLKAGSGYMPADGWGHGFYQGPQVVQGLTFDLSSAEKRLEWAGLNETLSRFELDSGEVCHALHENLCLGIYQPHGFTTPDAVG